jgi:hypothetical protein
VPCSRRAGGARQLPGTGPTRPVLSDTGSDAVSDVAAALMLATSEFLASAGRAALGVECVERAFRALQGAPTLPQPPGARYAR